VIPTDRNILAVVYQELEHSHNTLLGAKLKNLVFDSLKAAVSEWAQELEFLLG